MKKINMLLILGACVFGFTLQSIAQKVLPEVTIVASNYKYINSVEDQDAAQPIRMLEREAAVFDLKNSEFYEDEYDQYFISFYIPEGKILAAYDKDGKILRTAEKFKNVALPQAVTKAIAQKYPNWSIAKDAYLVSYYEGNYVAKKRYKILLENGNKRLRVKVDDKGMFL